MEFLLFGGLVFWLVPWLLAVATGHPRHGAILALTLLLGWTGVGWFVALWWTWPPRPRHAALCVVSLPEPAPRLPHADRHRGTARLHLRTAICVCCVPMATMGAGALLEAQPAFSPYRETLRSQTASLRAGPGAGFREVGVLRAPCILRVVEETRWWKHVWKTGSCDSLSTGRSEGWIRSERAHIPGA